MYYDNNGKRSVENLKRAVNSYPIVFFALAVSVACLAGSLDFKRLESENGGFCYGNFGGEANLAGFSEDKFNGNVLDSFGFKNMQRNVPCSLGLDLLTKILVDGKEKFLYVKSGSKVSDVLKAGGISIGAFDEINFKLDETVRDCTPIIIKRVNINTHVERVQIPYSTKEIPTNDLYVGQTQVKTVGENGEIEKVFENRIVDGKIVEIKEVGCNIIKPKVDQVVFVGTRKKSRSVGGMLSSFGGRNGDVATVTAYCDRGRTATGTQAGPGTIAANLKKVKPGTKLKFVNLKTNQTEYEGVVTDTGGALKSGKADFDIWLKSEKLCKDFGVKKYRIVF